MLISLNKRLESILEYVRPNLIYVSFVVILGFPLYYIIWQYIFPQQYENLTLRLVGLVSFLPLLLYKFLPRFFKKYFHWYFALSCFYVMPFFFSFMLIKNQFSVVWSMSAIAALFLFVIIMYDWLFVVFSTIFGFVLAVFATNENILTYFKIDHLPIYLFALLGGIIFNYRNELNNKTKLLLAKNLSGSIAHEMRNPLSSIKLLSQEIRNLSNNISNKQIEKIKSQLLDLDLSINRSINRANDIISITLNDIKEQNYSSAFSYLSASDVIKSSLLEYGYKDDEQRKKVKFLNSENEEENDFIFKGDETLLIYVFFNLIKNSLYYTEEYPNSIVTISIQKADNKNDIEKGNKSKNKIFHQIIVRDEGPGVPKNKLESIFEPFNTSGKVGGTGLGLPFCKRTMGTLQGEVYCRSELGKYTEFVLLLPALSDEELEIAKEKINQSQSKPIKILIVDDQETNLRINKAIIEKGLKNVICDLTKDGKEALEMFKAKNKESKNSENSQNSGYYDIILTDIEMPIMSGIELSREIRKIDKQVPIISYTSVLTDEMKAISKEAGIDDFLTKPIPHNYLIKTICKWTLTQNNQEDSIQNQTDESLKEILKGKRLLLADDEMVNRMLLAKSLKSLGLEVDSISDGNEILEKYQENIKDDSAKKYDIILTDINMQKLNGDLATIKIREFESNNNIENGIPIIAYSGDGDVKDIHKFLRSGMDDYFIKGNDIKNLIDIVSFWVSFRDSKSL